MKKIYNLVLVTGMLLLSLGAVSQPPPPPGNPSSDVVGGNAPVGAPVGSGTIILITLAAAYAGRKAYQLHTESEQE